MKPITATDRTLAHSFAGVRPFEVDAGGASGVIRAASSFDAVLASMTDDGGRVEARPAALRLAAQQAAADRRALLQQIDRPSLLTRACMGDLR
jgi:hypothetical protein